MPKMRVHEIAKQLNVNSKVLLDKLNSMGIEAKNHMSTVEGEDAQKILDMYSGKKAQPDKPADAPEAKPANVQTMAERMAAERAATAELKAIEAEKARKIADKAAKIEAKAAAKAAAKEAEMEAAKLEREKKELDEKQKTEEAAAAAKKAAAAEANHPERRPRPDGEEPMRPDGERPPRPPRPDGERPRRPRPDGERPHRPRPDGERPMRPDGERPPRPPRPDGERPMRPEGERTPRPPRPEGERYTRPEGERPPRPPRPEGERYTRPEGERTPRPPRPEGERYTRPEGERTPRPPRPEGERYTRPEGERTPRPPRPEGERYTRPEGERTPRPPRPEGERYQRPDGERPKYPRTDGTRPPYSGSSGGPRPPRTNDGQRPPRPEGQRPFDGTRREGFQKPGGTGWQKDKPAGGRPGFRGRDDKPIDKVKQFSAPPDPVAAKVTKSPSRIAAKSIKKGKEDKTGAGFSSKEGKAPFVHKSLAKPQPAVKGKRKKDKNKLAEVELPKEDITIETDFTGEVLYAVIPKSVKVKDFAEKINKPTAEIIKHLMKRGILANLNQEVDFYVMSKVAEEYGITVEKAEEDDILGEAFKEIHDKVDARHLRERPPIVVVMGHVDHGKTSLLDSIRKTNVTAGEAGGITQHIGAYTVSINDRLITFLDTPGHEAFTAMRLRGAQVTDVAIIVVAADDGVMPQTIEAIDHAKAAGVEIVVAINKIDKPTANLDRVKQEFTEHGLLAEDWGGETIFAPVSAKTGDGIEQLLEMVLLVADMKELQADPQKKARGTVIEALLDKGRGPVATVLIQDGTLRIGDPIVVGSTFGKIRAMMDDKGKKVIKAGPAIPVEILGLSEVPSAGDMFYVAQSEKQARTLAESMIAHGRQSLIKDTPQKVSLNDLFSQIQAGKVKDLNIVVKADVQGSVEAIKNSLERLSNDEVRVRIIHGGVGAITESDVTLASASNAIVIGFNVRPEASAKSVADNEKVDVRMYRIIYNAIEDITAAMKGMLDPEYEEKVLGQAEIRQIFKASGVGNIAGCYVTSGKIVRNGQVRLFRDNKVVYEGTLDALKRFKDDAKEVTHGYECGITFNKFGDIKENDIVECFVIEQIPR